MKRINTIIVTVSILLAVVAGVALAQQDPTMGLRAEIIRLKSQLWDQQTAYTAQIQQDRQQYNQMIERGAQIATASGDTSLVRQFRDAGYPVDQK